MISESSNGRGKYRKFFSMYMVSFMQVHCLNFYKNNTVKVVEVFPWDQLRWDLVNSSLTDSAISLWKHHPSNSLKMFHP